MRYSSMTQRLHSEAMKGWQMLMEARKDQAAGKSPIIMSVGDPDFDTPKPVTEAAIQALERGDTHYTGSLGRIELRELVAQRFAESNGGSWSAENVAVTVGTQGALYGAAMCLLDAGDEALTFDPTYLTYEPTFTATGATLTRVSQDPDDNFRFDPDLLADRISRQTKAMIITTPNNPTGAVATRQELEGLAELAIRHDLWVIADEVYADLIYDGVHCSIAALDGMAERTVTVSSLSKSHAMTGWRAGWAIGPTELIHYFDRLGMAMTYGLPGFVQQAALVALQDQTIASTMLETYQRRRDVVVEELAKSTRLKTLVPAAGMYVMVDVRGLTETSFDFARDLYRSTEVSVVDAGAFGQSTQGWLRLAFTIDEESLREGCRRLVEFADGLN